MGHKNQPRGKFTEEIEGIASPLDRLAFSLKFARMALNTLPLPTPATAQQTSGVLKRADALFQRVQDGVILGTRHEEVDGANVEVPGAVLSSDAQQALAELRIMVYPEHREYAAAHETLDALVRRGEWAIEQLRAGKRWWQFWKGSL